MSLLHQAFAILLYIVMARFVVRRCGGVVRNAIFALLNILFVFLLFFYGKDSRFLAVFFAYVFFVLVQYGMVCLFAKKKDWRAWLAFFFPIAALIFLRYVPVLWLSGFSTSLKTAAQWNPEATLAPYFLGFSYLAFKSSFLVIEIRNGTVRRPDLFSFLGYCFFVPTMSVGPINPYSNHCKPFENEGPDIASGRAVLRILVGLVKYQFLGNIFNQLSYSVLLQDGHPHPWIDLPVAAIFYYLYLYSNFSGFCDIAIGAAGLIGVPVAENFNNPFGARNVKEFWNRWHITLSDYMREVVFTPFSKLLIARAGIARANHVIAIVIFVVFFLVGIWHGVGWNYVVFGALHGFGVVVNHYYAIFLKSKLGRDGFKAYNANRWIHAAAVVFTFCYISMTLFFFANNFQEISEIVSNLR